MEGKLGKIINSFLLNFRNESEFRKNTEEWRKLSLGEGFTNRKKNEFEN
jgi:hypothetical protein